MNDNDVLGLLRDGLSRVDMDTPAETIIASGSARRRRRRLSALAGVAAVVTAAAMVPALGGTAPAPPPGGDRSQTAAFTLVSNADGTATLTLPKSKLLEPESLRRALADAEIPARVEVGRFCASAGTPPSPDWLMRSTKRGGETIVDINPAGIPADTMLSIGFRSGWDASPDDRIRFTLVWDGGPMTCVDYE